MRKAYNIINIILILSVVISSCKEEDINKAAPELTSENLFVNSNNQFYDTIKLDYKLMGRYLFNVVDEGKVDLTLRVENFTSNIARIAINGDIQDDLITTTKISNSKTLEIIVIFNANNKNTLQTAHFTLELADGINQKSPTYEFFVSGFEKLAPISKFKVEKVNLISNFEYEIDASASYDQDYKFGGKIVKYLYQIDNKVRLKSRESKIKYSFPGEGAYQISVIVFDNHNLKGISQKNIVIKQDGKK